MPLLVSFLAVSFGAFFALWGLSTFVQGWLYNTPAERLPLRAAAAGLLVGCYVGLWTWVNTRADVPNKYGTFTEFVSERPMPIDKFKAVRLNPVSKEEQTVAFAKVPGSPGQFAELATKKEAKESTLVRTKDDNAEKGKLDVDATKPFRLNDSNYLTVAILVPEEGKPDARFEAELAESRAGKSYANTEKRFNDKASSRYLKGESPGTVYVPSRGGIVGALAFNATIFVIWFLAFWPLLRYGILHSVGLALVFGLASIVILMPLMFDKNQPKPVAALAQPLTASTTSKGDTVQYSVAWVKPTFVSSA